MGKKPKRVRPYYHPAAIKELKAYLRSRWKLIAGSIGAVVFLFTSAGAISKNWDVVESNWVATRGYVRTHVLLAQAPQTLITRDLQIDINEGKRSNAANDLAKWKLERSKTKDPITIELIDKQITEREGEVERLNEQRRVLNRLKAQGQ